MSSACRFDDSLPVMLDAIARVMGRAALEAGVVLRDASGRLTFVSDAKSSESTELLAAELRTSLSSYAHDNRVIISSDDPVAELFLRHPDVRTLEVVTAAGGYRIRYLDRRIVGADWIRPASSESTKDDGKAASAVRIAFTSLKGGVGRSTALTIVASEQARKGRNVLVVDLDLEAPGIGSLLLSEDRMPSFGIVDYLVERNFAPVDRGLLQDMIGISALTQGQGLVDVAPAIGLRSLKDPGNYLGKLSRAMLEATPNEGNSLPLAGKLAEMLHELETLKRYDLVLLDVRAGLAELAAGPLLALGAEILIFATSQRQSLQDLRFLLAHLSTITQSSDASLRERLKMVHAKASSSTLAEAFRDDLLDLFSEYLYDDAEGIEEFNFDGNDPIAPHFPISIPLDTAFADWDPVSHPHQLVDTYYSRTFGALLAYVEELLSAEHNNGEE